MREAARSPVDARQLGPCAPRRGVDALRPYVQTGQVASLHPSTLARLGRQSSPSSDGTLVGCMPNAPNAGHRFAGGMLAGAVILTCRNQLVLSRRPQAHGKAIPDQQTVRSRRTRGALVCSSLQRAASSLSRGRPGRFGESRRLLPQLHSDRSTPEHCDVPGRLWPLGPRGLIAGVLLIANRTALRAIRIFPRKLQADGGMGLCGTDVCPTSPGGVVRAASKGNPTVASGLSEDATD